MLLSLVAPAVACMAPEGQMTVDEQMCCRVMKSQCGQMEMPASHDCCKKSQDSIRESALKTDSKSFHLTFAVVLCVSCLELFSPHDTRNAWVQRPEHSPPKLPAASISILRV